MKAITIGANQFYKGGYRLDASYHASEGVAAAQLINQWLNRLNVKAARTAVYFREPSPTYNGRRVDKLADLARLFNGPRFARTYITDQSRGIPFLSSSDMMQSDLRSVKLLSRALTPSKLLEAIRLHQGWALISCSGTIGNAVFVRPDMDGMTGSQHIMRVAPKAGMILAGYLYAFLSSKIGYALVTQGTYGAVVHHIEPEHIVDLPIPRLDPATEQHIHEMIEQAAALRVEANLGLATTRADITRRLGLPTDFSARYDHARTIGDSSLHSTALRLDAYYYIGYAGEAAYAMRQLQLPQRKLSEIAVEIFNAPIFKRVYVGSDGMPYFLGYEIYECHPRPSRYLARSTKDLERYVLHEGMIIIQDAGQRYGLLGTPIYANRTLDGKAATNNMIRIVSPDRETAGYLFAFLDTEIGRRLIVRESYGSSLPHIYPAWLGAIPVPWPHYAIRSELGKRVIQAFDKRADANDLEDEAQTLLAKALDLEHQGGF